jgi:hypothetical protein
MDEHPASSNPILDGYLPQADTARALGKCVRTLKRWRTKRYGPPVTWIGNRPLYRIEAVREWLATQEQPQVRANSKRGRSS